MSVPLPGLCPAAVQAVIPVVEQVRLATDTYRLRLECPQIAREVVPGQFFMIREPGTYLPLLGRPFALYDTWLDSRGQPAGIDVVYLVVGRMTGVMSHWKAGDHVEVWGPLGNGFPTPPAGRLLLVAGGIGNTPFPAVAREAIGQRKYGPRTVASRPASEVAFCYGVRSASYFAGLDDFRSFGIHLALATDDGSAGHHGFVTDLVSEHLAREGARRDLLLRAGEDDARRGDARRAGPRPVLALAGDAHGLRLRGVFQLRHEGPHA